MADDNALLAIIKAARVKGKSYAEIETLYGIPAPRAEALVSAHYAQMKISPEEYRLLQLERLEGIIDVLMSMAQMGNVKSAEVLIKNLESINTLLGLNLETTKMEIKIVTEQQSQVIYQLVSGTTDDLLKLVQSVVTNQKQLAEIEEKWDHVADDAYSKKVEEVIEAEMVDA